MHSQSKHVNLGWLQAAPGGIAGLFLVRVALEAAWRPVPGPLIVAAALLGAVVGFVIARVPAGPQTSRWGTLPLLAYVLWPQRDPTVAASVALIATLVWLLAWVDRSVPRWLEPLVDGATFLVALLVYVATAATDVLPADSGEFQLAAALLGVAHPPGYPLYTLMGNVFIRLLPLGTPAYRLNLMSAVIAAATLPLVARATRLWARQMGASPRLEIAGGLTAALTLGTATTFWAQATIANIRSLTIFFAALALLALARFAAAEDEGGAGRALGLLGGAVGLGLGHYPSLGFVVLFFVVYVLLMDPRLVVSPNRWWRPVLSGAVGFLPLAYLPIRGAMGAVLAPDDIDTLSGFLEHVTARGFAGDMFAYANTTDLPHRVALLPTLFPFQFNAVLLVGAAAGLAGLLWHNRRLFLLLAGSLTVQAFVTITYRAPQTVEYLMPAYLPIAIAVGLLPATLYGRGLVAASPIRFFASCLVAAILLWAGLFNGYAHAPSFGELADDHLTRETVEPLLAQAPVDALILADLRWAMPLRYLWQVEGRRPDVEVQYVYPIPGEEYRDTWLQRVRNAGTGVPLLLTHFYEFSGYTTEPLEAGFLLQTRPATEPAAPLVPSNVIFGDQVRLIGYELTQEQFHPGQVVEFVLAWQPAGLLDPPPSFTMRLVGEDGSTCGQADLALSTDVEPGEIRFARLYLPLYPTLPPGQYQVALGAYTTTGGGFETLLTNDGETSAMLTELELASPGRPPFTLHSSTVPFTDGPTLVGVDYDRSVPGTLRVYTNWKGPADVGQRLTIWTGDGPGPVARLPRFGADAYQTIAVDVPEEPGGGMWLSLTETQEQVKAAGPWAWPTYRVRLPTPSRDARFVPLGADIALIGVTPHPAVPGDVMAVDLTLVGLRPLTTDAATSVRLMDAGGRWLDHHDMQPALGAVPTLKWIRGSRVTDRHLLQVPADFTGDSMRGALVAYERFRLVPLIPMDGRFSDVPLGSWPLSR